MINIYCCEKKDGVYQLGYTYHHFTVEKVHYVLEKADSFVDLKHKFIGDCLQVISANISRFHYDCINENEKEMMIPLYEENLKNVYNCCTWVAEEGKEAGNVSRVCSNIIRVKETFKQAVVTDHQHAYYHIIMDTCKKLADFDTYAAKHFS